MLIKFIRRNEVFTFFLAVIFLALAGLFHGLGWIPFLEEDGMFWSDALLDNVSIYAGLPFSILVCLGYAILLSRLIQSNGILGRLSNATIPVSILLSLLIPFGSTGLLIWPAMGLWLIFYNKLFQVFEEHKTAFAVFDAGLILGLLSFVFPFSYIFSLTLVHALIITNQFSLRRLFLLVIGVLAPAYTFNAVAYIFGISFIWPFELPNIQWFEQTFPEHLVLVGFAAFVGIISLWSFRYLTVATMREKRKWSLIIGAVALATPALFVTNQHSDMAYLHIPLTMVLARVVVVEPKKWISELILWICIAAVFLWKIIAPEA